MDTIVTHTLSRTEALQELMCRLFERWPADMPLPMHGVDTPHYLVGFNETTASGRRWLCVSPYNPAAGKEVAMANSFNVCPCCLQRVPKVQS